MPRNGNGTYVLPVGQPVVPATTVSSSVFNALTNDLGAELTRSVSTDGQTPMAANLGMGGFRVTNLAQGTQPADAVRLDQMLTLDSAVSHAVAIIGFDATSLPDGATVIFSGRSASNDGGGGTFIYSETSIETADGGMVFAPTGGGRLLRMGYTIFGFNGSANANWWGAKRDGTDDTVACQTAINATIPRGIQIDFCGHYAVDTLIVPDSTYAGTLHCTEATFDGIATVSRPALLDIVNCYALKIIRPRFSTGNNPNYVAGLRVRATSGTSQSTTRFFLDCPTFRNFKKAIQFGSYDITYQCSEAIVVGIQMFGCPIGVHLGGSQTGCTFVGGSITSEPNATLGGPEIAIWQEGGFMSTQGTDIEKANTPTGQAILFNPAADTSNPYGILRIAGGQIESACQLLAISNPRGLATPRAFESSISINCAGGYTSPASIASDFITNTDATYAGTLYVTGPGFYCLGANRTAYNISSASPTMRIYTDATAFGTGFLPWLGGISGGMVLHDYQPVVSASGLNVTLPAGISILKFVNNDTTFNFGRYGIRYDPTTGLFTVPAGAFTTLDIDAGVVGGNGIKGDMFIQKGSNVVKYGYYDGTVGYVRAVLHNLVAGDTIGVYIRMTTTGGNFDSSVLQTLKINGATT